MGGDAGCGVSRPRPSCSADLGGSSNDSKDLLGRLKWSKVPWEPRRAMGESVLRARLRLVGERRKGIRFAFLNHSIGEYAVATLSRAPLGDAGLPSGKSSRLLVTATEALEAGELERGPSSWERTASPWAVSRAGRTVLENPSGPVSLSRGRRSSNPLAVLITASGLQGQQPLVSRTR